MKAVDLVTIGIAAYNAENTIGRAVESALAQHWDALEIIVVDDCSMDVTAAGVDELASKHPNLRLIRHAQNGGVAVARNTILREASGEFVVFFDDDDHSLPDRIAKQVRRIRDYERRFGREAPVVCHTARRQIFSDGSIRIETTMGTRRQRPAPAGIKVARRILKGTPLRDGFGSCATCSQMARLSTYRMVSGFDPKFRRSEDTELCVRLALAGAHFVGLAEPLVVQHLTVTSDKSLDDELRYALEVVQKHRSQFESDMEAEFALAWLTLKYDLLRKNASIGDVLQLGFRHPLSVLRRAIYAVPMAASRASIRKLHGKEPQVRP
jgi:glycosyltransferase involved in cell wall biosynthesis